MTSLSVDTDSRGGTALGTGKYPEYDGKAPLTLPFWTWDDTKLDMSLGGFFVAYSARTESDVSSYKNCGVCCSSCRCSSSTDSGLAVRTGEARQ